MFLTGMSLWFYGYFNVSYLALILASILANYLISLALEKGLIHRYTEMGLGVLVNLGLLFYFKYYDFFVSNINAVFKTDYNLKHILLPLGISFFTFQQLSYMIDRGRGEADHYGLIDYMAYVTFFPQLIAGPIVLHTEFMSQFKDYESRKFIADMMYEGVISFVIGLGKKVLLADTLAIVVNYGFDNYLMLDTFSTVAVMTAYLMELYFDFSGYSDMAIGLGLMFGIRLPINFDSPYKSATLKELWTRWHMTLTRFMTKYVYIPLGGSRKGKIRTLINVFVVFLLSGLWHGAAWTYVVWGIATGIIVVWDNIIPIKLPKYIGILLTDITFTLLLIPFRSENLMVAGCIFKDLIKGWTGNLPKMAGTVMNMPELYIPAQITERMLPEGSAVYMNVIWLIVLLAIGLFVLTRANATYIRTQCRNRRFIIPFIAIVFAYSVISLSQVSTFIYFNF